MLKGILKDPEFNSSDEIEETFAAAWNDVTFSDVQGVFHNWRSRLAWVIKNGGESNLKSMRNSLLMVNECRNRRGLGMSFATSTMFGERYRVFHST
jgi:hypothetical protein